MSIFFALFSNNFTVLYDHFYTMLANTVVAPAKLDNAINL